MRVLSEELLLIVKELFFILEFMYYCLSTLLENNKTKA